MFSLRSFIVLGLAAAMGSAQAVVFTATSGTRSAEVEFTTDGSSLFVKLKNTSAFDCLVPADVLSGLFFNLDGQALTPTSATVSAGSAVYKDGTQTLAGGSDVGGAWAYKAGISPTVSGASKGIGSAGFGIFGPADVFPGNNADGDPGVDGLSFGLLSAGDNLATQNGGMAGRELTKNSMDYVLSGLNGSFDLGQISDVAFQYGTNLSEPRLVTPEPCTLLAIGALALLKRRRKSV